MARYDEVNINVKCRSAKVAILLCTYNSSKFLRDQIDSFFTQTYDDWELWVADDGSQDNTREIVQSYSSSGKKFVLLDGPCRGATVNFLSLLRNAEITADYFAWSDADDIWCPDKLERAVRNLDAVEPHQAALYCGRTLLVDENNMKIQPSSLFMRPPCFQNALCQNIGGGNTMVFNQKARELLCAGSFPDVFFHDWWAYILVSGCGGFVYYDPEPCLRYRQHGGNAIGGNLGPSARFHRFFRLFRGAMRVWNRAHVLELNLRRDYLTAESRESVAHFEQCIDACHFWERFSHFRRSGAFRQRRMDNYALMAAVGIGAYP